MKLRIPLLIANILKLLHFLLSVLKLRLFCWSLWFQIIVDLNMIPSYPCLIYSLVSCTSDGFFWNSVLWVSSSVTFLKLIRSSWFWSLRWHNEVTPDETSDTPPDRKHFEIVPNSVISIEAAVHLLFMMTSNHCWFKHDYQLSLSEPLSCICCSSECF